VICLRWVSRSGGISIEYRRAFADALIDVAREDGRIVLVESDIASPAREWFQKYRPDRFINTGIAEQNAIGVCAGLASEGFIPFYYTYGFIIERTYNQIKQSIIANQHNVKIFAYNCGGTGMGGASHNEIYDLALMKVLPDLEILAPTSIHDMEIAVKRCVATAGPCYVRFPRGHAEDGVIIRTKVHTDTLVLALGSTYGKVAKAVDSIPHNKIDIYPVMDFKSVKIQDIKRYAKIITVEDHSRVGGFGESIGAQLIMYHYDGDFKIVGLPNELPPCNNGDYGITVESLVEEFKW
jgi:transketolase